MPLTLALVALSYSVTVAGTPDPPDTVGRIAFVAGAVSTYADRSASAEPVEVNWPTIAGDRLLTGGGSRTELVLTAATLRLDEESALAIIELTPTFARLRLEQGLVDIHMPDRPRRSVILLEAAKSAVELNATGDYRFRVGVDDIAQIVVHTGHVKVRTSLLLFHQYAGERAQIEADGTIDVRTESRKPFPDQKMATRVPQRRGTHTEPHVARNLVGYEELDAHGTWQWEREYGMVWEPRSTRANWAPFRFGHWRWKAPWGWTWIDDAPWGFATTHYGRWVNIEGRWKWMPGARQIDAVYAPALVGWLRDPLSPELIGWYPIGPDQEYVPTYPASDAHSRRLNIVVSTPRAGLSRRGASAMSPDVSAGVTWTPSAAFSGHSLPTAPDTHIAADPGVMSR